MRKEEVVLFPAIAELETAQAEGRKPAPFPFGTVSHPIRMMMHEHDSAGQALEQMRSLAEGYTLPEDGCATYRTLFEGLQALEADLHQHIHLENNILFPRAARLEAVIR
jgi:regulator of cell morphogenesis and NO signaling